MLCRTMIQHLEGDCRDILPSLPPKSVKCCVTSPPYWGLRSYLSANHPDKHREIGQEPTLAAYIETLVGVFREVARVLMNDGTLWLNLGDVYATDKKRARRAGVAQGDLIGLPWRTALALQASGWCLRSEIIWHKPNPKPESVTDRPTKSHEHIFLLTQSLRYHYDIDALREKVTSTGGASFGKQLHSTEGTGAQARRLKSASERNHPKGKNKRSVWSVPVSTFRGAHFAVFPPALIRPCVLAGCPEGGTVLDPFGGSGTTAVVAAELGRNAILIDLDPICTTLVKQRVATVSVLQSTPKPTTAIAAQVPARELPPATPLPAKSPTAVKQRSLWEDS